MIDIDEKLVPRDAALHLGLAPSTLAKMRCCGGSPPFLRLGRKIVYVRADLDAWLAMRRVRNTIEGDKLPRRLTDETHLDEWAEPKIVAPRRSDIGKGK